MRIYPLIFDVVFRRMNAELAHNIGMLGVRILGATGLGALATRRLLKRARSTEVLGLRFAHPFGIAAGFDKNAKAIDALGALGFSHVEVGTVTPLPQGGNPKPRLFRLLADRALINRMGFNNRGAAEALARIRAARRRGVVVGVNIGKNKLTSEADAAADYAFLARTFAADADYLAINVSSPNTPGLRGLQERTALQEIADAVLEHAGSTPVLVKIAPDLSDSEVEQVCALVRESSLAGIIATNTTISREGLRTPVSEVESYGAGGVSGPVLAPRSLEVLRLVRRSVGGEATVISVGGVTTGADVAERLAAGADLVQGYTAFLYEGPLWAARVAAEAGDLAPTPHAA